MLVTRSVKTKKKQLEKTLSLFTQHGDSGLTPIAEYIKMMNQLANNPVAMLYDKKGIRFYALKEVV